MTGAPPFRAGTRRISNDKSFLGTAAYMSPEQTPGQAVDKRTDIWAFGCVLYEMFTGRTAFQDETISDTIAAILGRGPDWKTLPDTTPANVRRLLQLGEGSLGDRVDARCVDAADVRLALRLGSGLVAGWNPRRVQVEQRAA